MRESIDNRLFFVYNKFEPIRSCGKVGRKKGMVMNMENTERTVRLFDRDSHLFTFTARVQSCTPGQAAGSYALILDRTAFFPEGGGQAADTGVKNSNVHNGLHPVIKICVVAAAFTGHHTGAPWGAGGTGRAKQRTGRWEDCTGDHLRAPTAALGRRVCGQLGTAGV